MPKYVNISKEYLYQLYIIENKSILEVADYFKVGKATIIRKIQMYNIHKPRDLTNKNISCKNKKYEVSIDDLTELYIVQDLCCKDIAVKLNVSERCISRFIAKYNLRKRNNIDKDTLYELYVVQNKNYTEIGKIINKTPITVSRNIEPFLEEFNAIKRLLIKEEKYKNQEPLASGTIQFKGCVYSHKFKIKKTPDSERYFLNVYYKKTGYKNPSQNPEVKKQKFNTMKKNNSFGKSKDEDIIYELLIQKGYTVIRQYYDREKYP